MFLSSDTVPHGHTVRCLFAAPSASVAVVAAKIDRVTTVFIGRCLSKNYMTTLSPRIACGIHGDTLTTCLEPRLCNGLMTYGSLVNNDVPCFGFGRVNR